MEAIRDGADLWPVLEIIGLAALLGALIGLEREWNGKPAGLRTHMLVAASSSLFVLLGFSAVETFRKLELASVRTDPIRILQAIVIGVSFLGAGTILRDRTGQVEGLTTAASVLITSAIGVAVALGHALLATILTVGVVVLLGSLGFVERYVIARARPPREDGA